MPWRWDLSTVANNLGLVAEAERGIALDNPPRDQAPPPPQPQLPGGAEAPVVPAVNCTTASGWMSRRSGCPTPRMVRRHP